MYGTHIRHAGHVRVVKNCIKKYGQPDYEDSANDDDTTAENRVSGRLHALPGGFPHVKPLPTNLM